MMGLYETVCEYVTNTRFGHSFGSFGYILYIDNLFLQLLTYKLI